MLQRIRKPLIIALLLVVVAGGIFYAIKNASDSSRDQREAKVENKKSKDEEEKAKSNTKKDDKEKESKKTSYDITLGFAGDINFADDHETTRHYQAKGASKMADVLSQDYVDAMNGMSLMWINNEFTYSKRGTPLPGKAYTFRSDPSHVAWLQELGIDIVGLANNHVYDYGKDAMLDTFDTLDQAGIPYVGAGRNLTEASQPIYLKTNGFTIAYVAASCAEKLKMTPQATDTEPGILRCYDNSIFIEKIKEAKANADYVIALPHWGTEYSTTLTSVQKNGAHAYIDAGADCVIGAHPHILQGMEYYNGKPIVYSLGNFWFNEKTLDTMVAVIEIRGDYEGKTPNLSNGQVTLKLLPGVQSGHETRMATDTGEKNRIFKALEDISVNVQIDADGIVRKKE